MAHPLKLLYIKTALLIFSIFLVSSINAQVFVKRDATGANNGTSWQNAYTNLDSAINQTVSGQIWVAAGTYFPSLPYPNNSYKTFTINKNISFFGGFKGFESNLTQRDVDNNETILSGDVGVAGNNLDNTPRVIAIIGSDIDSTTIIDGFIVTKSYYTGFNGYNYQNGGIFISCNGTPIIRNCTIKDNIGFWGGGIYVSNSKPLIFNNLITNNTAYEGAGIYLDYAGDARVISNRIINNKCAGGYTNLAGGGIQIEAYCAPYIYGNLIDNNQSGTHGGGISVQSNYSAVISNNIISNNTSKDGGGIYVDFTATDIINNLIVNNKATGSGGGMYVNYSFATRSVNNTIVNNSSDNFGGAIFLEDGNMYLVNTVIYKNPTRYDKPFNSHNPNRTDWFPKFDYCNVEGGKQGITYTGPIKIDSIWRTGNISVYPNFIDTANANYQLPAVSACINAGIPDTAGLGLPATDIKGAARIINNRIDMGCYEYDSLYTNTDSLIISPGTVTLEGKADSTFNINIHSNTAWTLTSKPDWVTATITRGANNAVIPITAMANPNLTTPRTGKIIISRPGIISPVQVIINQSASAYLTVSPDTVYINSQKNDSALFYIQSNLSWYVTGNYNWFSFDKFYGYDTSAIAVKATANLTDSSRTAQIYIFSDYYNINPVIRQTIVIIQSPTFFTICQNGNDSLTSNITGSNYQWQADTGRGFTNITNGNNYDGANDNNLKLHNIPTSYYGYKYKCVVNGVNSNVYTLRVGNVWTGSVSNQWENQLNWTCGYIPDANTDVTVPQGSAVINVNTTIRTLKVKADVKVTVKPGVNITVRY